jgi:hypothetical protein
VIFFCDRIGDMFLKIQNIIKIFLTTRSPYMYRKKSDKDLLSAAATSAIGAGVVTTFAVSQGQHPAIAMAITGIAALFAVICHQFDLI